MSKEYKNVFLVATATIAGGMFCNYSRNIMEGIAANCPAFSLLPDALFVIAFALFIAAIIMIVLSQERATFVLLALAAIAALAGGITSLVQVFF